MAGLTIPEFQFYVKRAKPSQTRGIALYEPKFGVFQSELTNICSRNRLKATLILDVWIAWQSESVNWNRLLLKHTQNSNVNWLYKN